MFSHTFKIILALFVLFTVAAYAVPADQPPAPQDSKTAAQQPAPTPEPARKPAQASSQKAAPNGVVVFIDPATGQIRQPDASEIGTLAPATGPVTPRTPATLLQGPGGAVGVRLGEDSLTYMVVTKAPDGKLDMDCITGDKAAAARVTPGTRPVPPQSKETPQGRASAQDTHDVTHDVKVPR